MDGGEIDAASVVASLTAGPSAPAPPVAPVAIPRTMPRSVVPAPEPHARSVRVAADRVDELLDVAGEAVLGRRRLAHLLGGDHDEAVREELDRGAALLGDLQQAVLGLRTLPLSSIVGPFPRAVRDMAGAEGREVELELEGVDTLLDRTILEGISDLIVHLLRNAVAHGIEPPDEREGAGKPRVGRIVLSAESPGDIVSVTVSDDGRGVAPELLARASTPEALGELLSMPGFSTADRPGELSGRGVGLDAVQRDLERLAGTLRVTSEPGRGSRFTMRMPATLAVLSVLTVERAGQRFGMPMMAMEQVVEPEQISVAGGREAVEVGEESLPVVDLLTVLGGHGPPPPVDGPVLVVVAHGRRAAVRCDRLLGDRDSVVKPLGPLLAGLSGYLGATILEDGRIGLLVDPGHLCGVAPTVAAGAVMPERPAAPPSPRVLVVDDQYTVRELQRRILGAAGYDVITARDGREALELLAVEAEVDLVLTDVEMPVLDGLGLLEALRADPAHASLPVVIVSSRGGEEDKRRGAEAGADAYVVKSQFDERALLEMVARLVVR
jgi:two-component system chemotaxis sensor kinase CheA